MTAAHLACAVAIMAMLIFLVVRDEKLVCNDAAATATTTETTIGSLGSESLSVATVCTDLACEQAASSRGSYQCYRPADLPIDTLSAADAWVLLGDDFAAGAPASSGSWWSELLARANTLASSQISIYNEAGPGIGQVSNLTLQIMALRRDTSAAPLLASSSKARLVVFLSIGRRSDSDLLSNVLEEMLDAIWHGENALINSHNSARITVVIVAPPDPFWGAVSPSAVYRNDVLSSCTFVEQTTWWQRKQWRQQTNQVLAAAATRNNAAFIDLNQVIGRYSLAGTSTVSTFDARCTEGDSTPHCNQHGQYVASEAIWQCIGTLEGVYAVPEMT